MQVVNDDMDELYKRAAEDYPLNTDSADWDAVLKKLSSEKTLNEPKNKNYRQLLWLLLLLTIGLGLVYKNYFPGDSKQTAEKVSKNIPGKNSPATSKPNNTGPISTSTQKNDVTTNNTIQILKKYSFIHRNEKGKLNSFISENSSETVIPENLSSNKTKVNEHERKESEVVPAVANKDIAESKNETSVKPADKVPGSIVNNKTEATKDPQKKNNTPKESGLYAGIILSPDISTVKFQHVNNMGVSMGVVAGYQLNKRISIESGVSWSIKNYHSKGDYFKTNNLRMPTGAKIIKVDGECNMIEVPIVVKYNFPSSARKNFSVSAGVSSYLMKKEKYDYDIARNGQQYPYSATYKKRSTDLLAVVNLAAGYNRQIKKEVNLRIEPYIKIPVQGVGIGSLPITSTGVNIGITKKLSGK